MTLVLIDGDDTRVIARVPEGEARREATLRDLIADHPEILPVQELDPSYGRLVTVAIELSISGVGFVDVLLIDEHGRLVVVECKLWRNPQARREVVGQILDYARELSRYGYEDLQRQVSIATKRQGNVLYALAKEAGSRLTEAEFVDRVARDLAAGRFLLMVVGDGITEGTRRIGEYLRDQPGLAFSFALIELAEYRHANADGAQRTIMHPRILAQTAVIERHVIRSDVPGIVIDTVADTGGTSSSATPRGASDAAVEWRRFADRFIADTRFDDPGQPLPRSGGTGWIRVPLPDGHYVNVYRSSSEGGVGAQVRFPGVDGAAAYEMLVAERDVIDLEFEAAGLERPAWRSGEVPTISLTQSMPPPWTNTTTTQHQHWMGVAANQFVNSLRPRLQRLAQELAA